MHTFVEIGKTIKLIRLITMYLKETYSEARLVKHLSDTSYSEGS
jgi:hypothetical protein